jgi:hypothetical protein
MLECIDYKINAIYLFLAMLSLVAEIAVKTGSRLQACSGGRLDQRFSP